MSRVRVAAVSYLNTVPMIYGITHAVPNELRAELVLCPPSQCADLIARGEVQIALVPVGALPTIKGARIITNYCISASGPVETVALLTNTDDLQNIHTIYLDSDSRTSVLLVRILAHEYWGIAPRYVDGIPALIDQGEAIVAIGDKVFECEAQFRSKIDLAQQWVKHTGLPFVFAVWIARDDIDQKIIERLDAAIGYGVRNIPQSVPWDENRERNLRYLTENIEFCLSDKKMKAINLFLSKL